MGGQVGGRFPGGPTPRAGVVRDEHVRMPLACRFQAQDVTTRYLLDFLGAASFYELIDRMVWPAGQLGVLASKAWRISRSVIFDRKSVCISPSRARRFPHKRESMPRTHCPASADGWR